MYNLGEVQMINELHTDFYFGFNILNIHGRPLVILGFDSHEEAASAHKAMKEIVAHAKMIKPTQIPLPFAYHVTLIEPEPPTACRRRRPAKFITPWASAAPTSLKQTYLVIFRPRNLLFPGIGHAPCEISDSGRRRVATRDVCDKLGRNERKRCKQANMTFDFALPVGNFAD